MKKLSTILFSTKATLVLLFIFAVAIGTATFIEDKYDTATAKHIIYHARWFELLFILLALNFIGNIKKYNLMRKGKLAGFLFHIAFIVLMIGAAITRYMGFDGSMHIRQGESSDVIYSSEPYLQILASDNNNNYSYATPLQLSAIGDNSFQIKIPIKEKGTLHVNYRNYIRNAMDTLIENVVGGENIIEAVVSFGNERNNIIIKEGENKDFGNWAISYNNNNKDNHTINITEDSGKLLLNSPFELSSTTMPSMTTDSVLKNSRTELKKKTLYENTDEGILFVITHQYKNAKKYFTEGTPGEQRNEKGPEALMLDIEWNGKKKEMELLGGVGYINNFQKTELDGIKIEIAYGEKEIKLPFSLFLNKFTLERYVGSMSPSSFQSEVTLTDNRKNLTEQHRIFMNNVLDYDGYRFFQSSYDNDEKGTILSVNHDFWGTWISYFGYFLLGVGFFFTLFSKKSRFFALSRYISELQRKRKNEISSPSNNINSAMWISKKKKEITTVALMLFFVLCINNFFFSQYVYSQQTNIHHVISKEHAEKFGHLIVQTYDGRCEPVHTLAYDLMHKISRKDEFDVSENEKVNAIQVFMDLILHTDFWRQEKIIYIREKSVADVLGVNGKYASLNDFFDENNNYRLKTYSEDAFRKKQSEQNSFDKEVIRVDERVNVCIMAINGSILKIFPAQNSKNNKWISWDDSLAFYPLTGSIRILNEDLQLREFNYSNMFGMYLSEAFKSSASGDYSKTDKILGYLDNIQRQNSSEIYLPSVAMVNLEIFYNKAQIFNQLRNWYGGLSVILLLLSFIDNLSIKKIRQRKILFFTIRYTTLSIFLNFFILLLGFAFLYHTFGMGLRWYLTGHAPWSNGYEALITIAWAGLLAGFSFVRYSKITLAATSLLTFFILMTAGHSNYDPQLTNLQPVLKSYWLIIHVAALTISYGFLGLGFFLGMINLFLYLFKTKNNFNRIDLIIKELSSINEMNLTIGLFLATLGTFLGGIWANESWGRYWGWDAKETWALAIVITYSIVLHLRLVHKLRGEFIFNIGSVIGFSSVLMTFIGVNYYLSKGLHSYASDSTPIFPIWAWGIILAVVFLMIIASRRERKFLKNECADIDNR